MGTIIKLRCIDQVLTFDSTPLIASGGVDEDRVQVEFCPKWDGLAKTAVFWRNEEEAVHVLLDEEDGCAIPPEVLLDEGRIYLGFFGVGADGKQRTSQVQSYNIVKGAITLASAPDNPTADLYTQLLARYAEVLVGANKAAEVAEAAAEVAEAAAEVAAAAAATAAGAAMSDLSNVSDEDMKAKVETSGFSSGVSMTLLWENASPTSDFASQKISLDLSEYTHVHLIMVLSPVWGGTIVGFSGIVPVGTLVYTSNAHHTQIDMRRATVLADGIDFGNGIHWAGTGNIEEPSNGCFIPYKIYGVKGVPA